jgi:hypothetical protein
MWEQSSEWQPCKENKMHIDNDAGQTITTTTETVVATFAQLQGSSSPTDPTAIVGVPTVVSGTLNITPGIASTAVTVRIRQNSLTGAVVGTPAEVDTDIAADPIDVPFEAYDAVGATTYVVTVQQTSATGNGTVNAISGDANPQ